MRYQALAFCAACIGETPPDLQAASLKILRKKVAAGVGVSLILQRAVQIGALLDDMAAYRQLGDRELFRDIALFHGPGFGRIRVVRLVVRRSGGFWAREVR